MGSVVGAVLRALGTEKCLIMMRMRDYHYEMKYD